MVVTTCTDESHRISCPQHSFLKNIQTFLHALTSSLGFEESDLFADSDLYDADNFKKVSKHTLGWEGLIALLMELLLGDAHFVLFVSSARSSELRMDVSATIAS